MTLLLVRYPLETNHDGLWNSRSEAEIFLYLFRKIVVLDKRGHAMIEFMIIMVFILLAFYGFTFSFKEILAPALKRMTAVIRWPIP